MIKPFYFLAFGLIVALAGCHRSLGPYRNINKWLIPQGNDRRPLEGKPKIVTEYNYAAADTADQAKRKVLYVKYCFGADGDLDSADTYMNDSLVMRSVNHFDAEGLQQTTTNIRTGQSIQTVTDQEPDGRYKTTANHAKSAPTIAYSSYTVDGRVEVEQGSTKSGQQGQGQGQGGQGQSGQGQAGQGQQHQGPSDVHVYYDGYRMTKVTGDAETGNLEEKFFYSKWDTPDSIDIYSGKPGDMKLVERQLFSINDHGDPVGYYQLVGRDTLVAQIFQYQYDQRGNWTRKISSQVRGAVPMSMIKNVPMVSERVFQY